MRLCSSNSIFSRQKNRGNGRNGGCTLRKEGRKKRVGTEAEIRNVVREDRCVTFQEKSHSRKLDGPGSTKARLAIKKFLRILSLSLFSFFIFDVFIFLSALDGDFFFLYRLELK